jgi:hypothetical protein
MVSITPRPYYPQGRSLLYPLARRLGGSQIRPESSVEDKNLLFQPGIKPLFFGYPARRYIDWTVLIPFIHIL